MSETIPAIVRNHLKDDDEMIFEITDQEQSEQDDEGEIVTNESRTISPVPSHRQQKIKIPKETQNLI